MIPDEAVEAMYARCRHECEAWQMQESARGGLYCAACGCPESYRDTPREQSL